MIVDYDFERPKYTLTITDGDANCPWCDKTNKELRFNVTAWARGYRWKWQSVTQGNPAVYCPYCGRKLEA